MKVMLQWVVPALVGTTLLSPAQAHPSPTHNSTTQCEAISDPDHRHFCRAVVGHDPLECELIHNHDLRQLCRAEATPK